MTTFVPFPPPGFDDLSVDEKSEYLELVLNRIATTSEMLPVPEWCREVISERLRDLESNPSSGDTWAVAQKRLRGSLSRKC
jgi:hypothetical protein